MADNIGNKAAHDYHLDVPAAQEGFYVKGNTHCDWGMKNRLSRMFDPKSGNTVMLAFDHGYIMGPTAGLERIDLVIPPLIPYVDVLMGTRGVIHSCISPTAQVGKCVRVTYDSTVLFDDMSNGSGFACDIDSVIRLNADCMAVQTFIGAAGESRSLELLARTADAGIKYGIPTLGVVAVGKDMERTEKFFQLATRVLAENGANVVKSYYCDGFERVAAACPVPIVNENDSVSSAEIETGRHKVLGDNDTLSAIVAELCQANLLILLSDIDGLYDADPRTHPGARLLHQVDALTPEVLEMAYKAIQEGAHGVDMGRNIFQSDCPAGMAQAIAKVVHEGYTAAQAFEIYETVKHQR